MPSFVIATCNALLGVLFAVVASLIAPLLFTPYRQFGLLLSLVAIGFVAVLFLLEWFDVRLRNVLAGWLGMPTALPTADDKPKVRPFYWGVLGFVVGLAVCMIWTPAAVLGTFRPFVR